MKPVDLLYSNNLKRTSCREGIIEVIQSSETALSEEDIRRKLSGNYDRSTFYRSFKTLEEHNVIHKIQIDSQVIKYALADKGADQKEHAHFYCKECHAVRCLDTPTVSFAWLPEGYTSEEAVVIVKGICSVCSHKNN